MFGTRQALRESQARETTARHAGVIWKQVAEALATELHSVRQQLAEAQAALNDSNNDEEI